MRAQEGEKAGRRRREAALPLAAHFSGASSAVAMGEQASAGWETHASATARHWVISHRLLLLFLTLSVSLSLSFPWL